jgi:hypothetical protein
MSKIKDKVVEIQTNSLHGLAYAIIDLMKKGKYAIFQVDEVKPTYWNITFH